VWLGDNDVTASAAASRNIAQVFQFPVLYEGMSVYDNLAFPLRNRRYAKDDVDRHVRRVSRLLGLDQDLRRRPRRLDPGRQQIVCLGRGLVRPDVAAVLLDEPLTVIDPGAKWMLRRKLKEAHRDTAHTLIYVTHDQTEALTFADEVVVLNDGVVVQTGEPAELFLSPRHEFVGHFIGSPGMNIIPAVIAAGGAVRVGEQAIGHAVPDEREMPPGPVRVGVRPEFVRAGTSASAPGIRARVTAVERMGSHDLVQSTVDGHRFTAKVPSGTPVTPGALEDFTFAADRVFLFRDQVRCGTVAAPARRDVA
jgi:glycerol transport system ATP-binding protein